MLLLAATDGWLHRIGVTRIQEAGFEHFPARPAGPTGLS
jgi:hypothetical protein